MKHGASPAILTDGLVKKFGHFTALDGLDLCVSQGEVHGFLGPNGAGKSTTIRVLLGLLRANSGHVELLGGDPWRDVVELHRRIAYVPGDVTLWQGLSGAEASTRYAARNCSSASSWTPPSEGASTARATARKSQSWRRSHRTRNC